MNTEQELRPLPCPFCGGDAIVVGHGPYRVACMKCTASLPHLYVVTEAEAIAAWNRRAPAVAAGGVTATWHPLDAEGYAELRVNGARITTFASYPAAEEAADRINKALAVGDEGIREVLRDALRFISNIDNAHPVVRKLRAALKDTTHAE